MVPEEYAELLYEFEPDGSPNVPFEAGLDLEQRGNLAGAATLLDRAYGLSSDRSDIAEARSRVLNQLKITEHGLVFRYVPAGVFLMGDAFAEHDERPLRPVWLEEYWLAEVPLSFDQYGRLDGWPEVARRPRERIEEEPMFWSMITDKLCWSYSIDRSLTSGRRRWEDATFRTKPMVAIGWDDARRLAQQISTGDVRYDLPTEAQWEKAARGGRIGQRWPWGDQPAGPDRCDCEAFDRLSILPSKHFPPNGYGLYAMVGSVWEWCADWYDRDYYPVADSRDPKGPETGEERVVRGGAWCDTRQVCTVSHRSSLSPNIGRGARGYLTPTIGARLCRTRVRR